MCWNEKQGIDVRSGSVYTLVSTTQIRYSLKTNI